MNKRICSILVLLVFINMIVIVGQNGLAKWWNTEPKESVLNDLPQVAHGLGYIDGHYVTNSMEALLLNYKRGFRVFEVDLNMTSDNRLIARHDWTPEHYLWLGQSFLPIDGPIPFRMVMAYKVHGKYHAATWEKLLKVMKKYPDIYLITDTKHNDEESVRKTFSYLVKATKKSDPKLLERIIPQFYNKEMLSYIRSYYDFKNVIYTLYQLTNENLPTPEELAEWCYQNKVTAVTAFPFRLTEEMRSALQAKNIKMYVHTINDQIEAANYKEKGIGIYTDYLLFNGEKFITPK
nr:phosphatidylinositol-specific phospholipase C/glycerophosphodiester phosphodiesterase family protein [Neobacillus sp. Marseille-Q6967]